MFFTLITMTILLRVYDYLPYESLAAEIATLVICSIFYIKRLNNQKKYNETQIKEIKNDLKQKIKKEEGYLKFTFTLFVCTILVGYYIITMQKNMFVRNEKFMCKSRGGQKVYIDKKDGWVLSDDYYFIKEKNKIKAFLCTKENQ